MSPLSRLVTLYLYSYFNQISTHFANAEALLRALEQVAQEQGTLYFKERTDEDCELILCANQGQFTYAYQCQQERAEPLNREQVLELIEEMYQGLHWDDEAWDDDDWLDEDDEEMEGSDYRALYLPNPGPRYG
jgi:hypothetical protein